MCMTVGLFPPVYRRALRHGPDPEGSPTDYIYLTCQRPALSHTCSNQRFIRPRYHVRFPPLFSSRCPSFAVPVASAAFFDSVISILLYHRAVYHLTYSASPPCSETQQLLSALFKDKARRGDTTARAHICSYGVHVRANTRVRMNWRAHGGDESSDSCSSLRATEFRISLVLKRAAKAR